MREEAKGEWENCLLRSVIIFYFSLDIIKVIKSRRMRWVWHIARMRKW